MKLKEKLAAGICWEDYSGSHIRVREAYLKGFEKARHLIVNHLGALPMFDEFLPEIEKIGEEEV